MDSSGANGAALGGGSTYSEVLLTDVRAGHVRADPKALSVPNPAEMNELGGIPRMSPSVFLQAFDSSDLGETWILLLWKSSVYWRDLTTEKYGQNEHETIGAPSGRTRGLS